MRRAISSIVLVLIGTIGFSLVSPAKAEAAVATCYNVSRVAAGAVDAEIVRVTCSADFRANSELARTQPGYQEFSGFPADNTCYLVETIGGQVSKAGFLANSNEWCLFLDAWANIDPRSVPNENNSAGALLADPEPEGGEGKTCGEGENEVKITINIGCRGTGNPIVDMVFAFTRFLSLGVGVVVVGSVIVGGIQYTTAGGDPQKTKLAISRITNSAAALMLYLLIFVLLNWLVPGGVF